MDITTGEAYSQYMYVDSTYFYAFVLTFNYY